MDQACNRFESAWKAAGPADSPPRIEDYLAAAAEPDRSALLRELIALDVFHRRRRGEAVRAEDYHGRFPAVVMSASSTPSAEAAATDTVSAHPASAAAGNDFRDLLAPPQEPDEMGRLGPYRVLRLLGRGGMGVVFEAEDPQLRRKVALKAMLPALAASEGARRRFLREGQAAAAIENDHIIPIYQVDQDRGIPFIAMPLLRGESLDELVKREGRLPVAEVLRIGREVARGLAAAHERGLIHRDIKPANLWLEARDEGRGASTAETPASGIARPSSSAPRVKILDFGLARAAPGDVELTQTGAIIGTPAYMSPEQANGESVDARSDLFSLGSVLYRLCTGELPFKGTDTTSTLLAVATAEPKPPGELNSEMSPALSDLILQMLAKNKGARPPSAEAVADALETLARELANEPQPRRLNRQAPRRRKQAVAATLLTGGLALAGFFFGPAIYRLATDQDQPVAEKDDSAPAKASPPARRVWPIDSLRREDIPAYELKVAGGGDPKKAPAGLVAVLGDGRMMNHWGQVFSMAFSPDGKKLASASHPAPMLWDVATGEELPLFRRSVPRARRVAFSPDGKTLLLDAGPEVRLCDLATGDVQLTFPILTGQFPLFAFSPDGQTLASAEKRRVKLWSLETGEERRTLARDTREVLCLAFSPDSKTLACGSKDDQAISLWDVATGKELPTLKDQRSSNLLSLAFNRDGTLLASASWDNSVRGWDVASGKPCFSLSHEVPVRTLAFHPDGRTLVSGDIRGVVQLWDLARRQGRSLLQGFGQGISSVAFSPDGDTLAVANVDGGIKLWDMAAGKEKLEPRARGAIHSLAVSPDGTTLATGTIDRQVQLWDLATGKVRTTFTGHTQVVSTLAFSPDSKTLASASGKGFGLGPRPCEMKLWDVAGAAERHSLNRARPIHAVAFSPDGATVAVAGDDRLITLVNATTGEPGRILQGHTQTVSCVAFSRDGRMLASGGQDWPKPGGELKLWDLASEKAPRSLKGHNTSVWSVSFSPDDKTLVSGSGEYNQLDGEAKIWDVSTGEELRMLRRGARIWSTIFSPDGKIVATSDGEGVVEFWDPEAPPGSGLLRQFPPHGPLGTQGTRQIAFSPDGRHLLAVHGNGIVYVMRLAPPSEREGGMPTAAK